MRIASILPFAALLLLLACSGTSSDNRENTGKTDDRADSLLQSVIHDHDTAMARMGKIRGLRKNVQAKLDSLSTLRGKAKTQVNDALENLKTDLKQAEDGMNAWMEEFELDSAADNAAKRLDYLKDEKLKVGKLKEDIRRALQKADSLLKRE